MTKNENSVGIVDNQIDDSNKNKNNKTKKKFHIKGTSVFIFVMLFYPVAHFLLMWFGVNINSILLTFKYNDQYGNFVWVKWNELFYNYQVLFKSFSLKDTQNMLLASGVYFIISCFITLPIALFFSYFIFKKIMGNGFFKIIFFLPSILPLVVLTLVFSLSFAPNGLLAPLLNAMNIPMGLFIGPSAKWMVWIFCIWAGIGYDVILLTSGMSRIPRDVLESCKMDGVPPMKEFFKIIIPLTWPTITTLFIFGMMSVFNVYLQPFFLTSGMYDTMTIGLKIYQESGGANLNTPATLGLFCSLVATPIILTTRWGLNKIYGDVNY